MTKHMAYRDNPMIPPVTHRQPMASHLGDIVSNLSYEILEWKNAGPFKRQAYAVLIKGGFQNQAFFDLAQLATDYCDYLIFEVRENAERAIVTGAAKALELHLALMIEKTGQLKAELPGVQNYYKARLSGYPELKRKIKEHLSSYGNNLGAKEMNGQPFQNPQGQWVFYNQQGQLQYYQPQPQHHQPDLTQQYEMSHARRQQMQYAPAQPVQQQYGPPPQYQQHPQYATQQQWGVNGVSPAVQYQQQQGQMANPQVPQGGGYTGYNPAVQPNQTVAMNNAGLGPVIPKQTGGAPHPGASATQRHTNFAPPQPADKAQPINAAGATGHQMNQQQAPQEPVVPAAPKAPTMTDIVETPSGYECSYRTGSAMLSGIMGIIPVIFDAASMKGIYQLDTEYRVTGFKLVHYKETEMDYKIHETAQFFNKTRAEADDPSKKETRAMLANIQRKLFIEEKLAEIENEVLEGNVTGDTGGHDLDDPVHIIETIYGGYSDSDYIGLLLQNCDSKEEVDRLNNRVVNFNHMSWNGINLEGKTAIIANGLRKCIDWAEVNDIMDELVEEGLPLSEWKLLNDILTSFVNDIVMYRFGLDIIIQSFNVDIRELVSVLYKDHAIRSEFSETVRELTGTALFPIMPGHEDYHYFVTLPELGEDDEPRDFDSMVTFTTLTDVTILPMESSSIYIPLPQQDGEWIDNGLPEACIVTWESFPELYTAIHDRVTNANIRAAHIVFVTLDGVNLYIKKTSSSDAYVISRIR